MVKKRSFFTISLLALMLVLGSLSFTFAETDYTSDRECHSLANSYCFFVQDVYIPAASVKAMSDADLAEYIISQSDVRMRYMSCTSSSNTALYRDTMPFYVSAGSLSQVRNAVPTASEAATAYVNLTFTLKSDTSKVYTATNCNNRGAGADGNGLVRVYVTYDSSVVTPQPDNGNQGGSTGGQVIYPDPDAQHQVAEPDAPADVEDPEVVEPENSQLPEGEVEEKPSPVEMLADPNSNIVGAMALALAGLLAVAFAASIIPDIKVLIWYYDKVNRRKKGE